MNNAIIDSDHNAYLVEPDKAEEAIASWEQLGLTVVNTIDTQEFPATHHFMGRPEADSPVISLIVPKDADTFLTQILDRQGSGSIYNAYQISPELDIDDLYDQMNAWGWKMLGSVYTWEDSKGPQQNAIAVAPANPYGPFTVFIQRRKKPADEGRQEIDLIILDEILESYARYCQETV